jgi:integrase
MIHGFTQPWEAGMSEPSDVALVAHHAYKSWSSSWWGPDRKPDGSLRRHTKRFGKEGEMTPKEARAAFRRWYQDDWKADVTVRVPSTYTVTDLCKDYYAYAQTIYVKNGRQTSAVAQVKRAMEQFGTMYGGLPITDITNPMLAKLRDGMIDDGKFGIKLTVRTVNERIRVIKRAFRWAREKGLVDKVTIADVVEVTVLVEGRCDARKTEPVVPVARETVDATLAGASQGFKDLVELMWLTGMRPGEACSLRPCDIDRGDAVWVYSPEFHKTEHKGKLRRITIGPEGQRILAPYLAKRMPSAAVFTRAEIRCKAGGPGWLKPQKPVTPGFICKMIDHLTGLAKIETWHGNQLRHAWATRVREAFGLEAASDGLGHSSLDMTLIYAERSLKRAKEVAAQVG